jgi:ABC-2 type transport system permease protein
VLLMSIRAASSRSALLVGLALWLGALVVGPRLAIEAATRLAPAPTPQEFLAALRDADRARPSYWEDLVPAATARLLSQYGVSRPEDLPVSPASVAQLDQEDDDTVRVGRVFEALYASHADQEWWLARFAWVTPILSVRQLSSAMAGTDAWHARHFAEQAEQYRRRAVRLLNEDSVRHNKGDFLKTGVRHEGDARLWASIPPFDGRPAKALDVLAVNRSHAVVLTAWSLLTILLTGIAAGRLRAA